jgi:hypothetical protein
MTRSVGLMAGIIVLTALTGCTGAPSRDPVPEAAVNTAATDLPSEVPSWIRVWGDELPATANWLLSLPPEQLKALMPAAFGKPHTYLAISGGGQDGAFGAGLLNGWTASGKRPTFTIVTGISTGALIAPFAFLGSEYDPVLTQVYTQYSTKDIVRKKNILSIVMSASAADTAPLKALIAHYVSPQVIAAIAAEHRAGRRLWIGTTNLDAGRPVLWNIGEIANSNDPQAPGLIHDILLASASIPAAFPPVLIQVQANGQSFDELHVDGGTTTQVFFYPAGLDWKKVLKKLNVPGTPDLYVIRNSFVHSDYLPTREKLIPITSRSVSTLLRTQGIGDLYRIYSVAVRDGIRYHLAYIPDDFDMKYNESFDPAYMRALYNVGYELGKSGKAWADKPPE